MSRNKVAVITKGCLIIIETPNKKNQNRLYYPISPLSSVYSYPRASATFLFVSLPS